MARENVLGWLWVAVVWVTFALLAGASAQCDGRTAAAVIPQVTPTPTLWMSATRSYTDVYIPIVMGGER